MIKVNKTRGLSPVFVIVLTLFIDITGYGIIIPLLPFYSREFQAGPAALGILIASFAIMQFFFSPILGKASDKKGRKPILLFSLLISLIGFTIFAFANSYILLLASRIIAGIATERAVAQAYIADITDQKTRTKEMGKIGAALGAGFIVGPVLGGTLGTYGFSIPGYAAMLLTSINILFVGLLLPEPQRKKENNEKKTSEGPSLLRGIYESLRKPLLGPTLLILFLITVAFSTIPVIVPLLSIDFFNFSSLELSFVFIYIGLIQIIMQGFLIGPLAKRLGEEKLIILGSILMAAGTLLMPVFQNVLFFFLTNSLIAAGFGLINTSIPAFISKKASINEQGSILGVVGSVASIANIPGPLVIGFIYAFAGSFIPFLISALILTVAFVVGCKIYTVDKLVKQ